MLRKSIETLDDGQILLRATMGPDRIMTPEEYEAYQKPMKEYMKSYKEKEKERLEHPSKRNINLFNNIYNAEVEKMIKGNGYSIVSFNAIKITQEAFEKANLIAKRAAELTGGKEICIFLIDYLNKKEENEAIRDIYILRNQHVSPVECGRPSVKGERESLEDIKTQGKYLFAWGHSHGDLGNFHSTTDNVNLNNVTAYGKRISLTPKPFSCSDTSFPFKYMPSLVFNARNDPPSCAVGISYPFFQSNSLSNRGFHINRQPVLQIIKEENNIEKSQEVIDQEILERVNTGIIPRVILHKKQKIIKPTTEQMIFLNRIKELFGQKTKEIEELKKAVTGLGNKYSLLEKDYYSMKEENSALQSRCSNLEARVKTLEGILSVEN